MPTPLFPRTSTLCETVRTHPGSLCRLRPLGVTGDDLELRLADVARRVGVSVARLSEVVAVQ